MKKKKIVIIRHARVLLSFVFTTRQEFSPPLLDHVYPRTSIRRFHSLGDYGNRIFISMLIIHSVLPTGKYSQQFEKQKTHLPPPPRFQAQNIFCSGHFDNCRSEFFQVNSLAPSSRSSAGSLFVFPFEVLYRNQSLLLVIIVFYQKKTPTKLVLNPRNGTTQKYSRKNVIINGNVPLRNGFVQFDNNWTLTNKPPLPAVK